MAAAKRLPTADWLRKYGAVKGEATSPRSAVPMTASQRSVPTVPSRCASRSRATASVHMGADSGPSCGQMLAVLTGDASSIHAQRNQSTSASVPRGGTLDSPNAHTVPLKAVGCPMGGSGKKG